MRSRPRETPIPPSRTKAISTRRTVTNPMGVRVARQPAETRELRSESGRRTGDRRVQPRADDVLKGEDRDQVDEATGENGDVEGVARGGHLDRGGTGSSGHGPGEVCHSRPGAPVLANRSGVLQASRLDDRATARRHAARRVASRSRARRRGTSRLHHARPRARSTGRAHARGPRSRALPLCSTRRGVRACATSTWRAATDARRSSSPAGSTEHGIIRRRRHHRQQVGLSLYGGLEQSTPAGTSRRSSRSRVSPRSWRRHARSSADVSTSTRSTARLPSPDPSATTGSSPRSGWPARRRLSCGRPHAERRDRRSARSSSRSGLESAASACSTWCKRPSTCLEPSLARGLAAAHAEGVGVIVKEAFANGRLSDANDLPEDRRPAPPRCVRSRSGEAVTRQPGRAGVRAGASLRRRRALGGGDRRAARSARACRWT